MPETGVHDSHRRQCLYLHLRHHGRNWWPGSSAWGSDPRIRGQQYGGVRWLRRHIVISWIGSGCTPAHGGSRPRSAPSGSPTAGQTIYAPGWHLGFNFPAFLIVPDSHHRAGEGHPESAAPQRDGFAQDHRDRRVYHCRIPLHPPAHWHPFFPNGWYGVLTGGRIIFFTYIGSIPSPRSGGVPPAAARCSHRHSSYPGGLHAALHRRGRGAHWLDPLADAGRQCGPVVNTLKN